MNEVESWCKNKRQQQKMKQNEYQHARVKLLLLKKHGRSICLAELKSKMYDVKREPKLCAVANPRSTNHANKREITILIQFENASSLCVYIHSVNICMYTFKRAHTHTHTFILFIFFSLSHAYTRDSSNSIACIHHLLVFRNIDLCLAIHCEIIRMTVESRLELW